MSVLALGSAQVARFMIIVTLMFAGIFVIAVVTPSLAAFIDKKRGKKPDYSQIPKAPISPFESAPLPERVEESNNFKKSSKPAITDSSKAEESNNFKKSSKPTTTDSSKAEESINLREGSIPNNAGSSKEEDNIISSVNPARQADASPENEGK